MTEHAEAHKSFKESENYGSMIYIREPLLKQLQPEDARVLIMLGDTIVEADLEAITGSEGVYFRFVP